MSKEKTITELRDERNQLTKRGKEIIDAAKKEKRGLSDTENTEVSEIQLDVRRLNLEIAEQEAENRSVGKPHTPVGQKRFSLVRAIRSQLNGSQQTDIEASAIEEATAIHQRAGVDSSGANSLIVPMETRAYTATKEAQIGVVVEEEQMELLLPLEANLVLSRAGVRMLTGLQGNISWPNHSATQVFWEKENATAKDGKGEFEKGKLFTPKRLTSYVDISRQLIIQENRSVEGLVRQLMAIAIAQKLEQTAFSTDAHEDVKPDGLFMDGNVSLEGDMNWANVVQMETKADLNNALFGNLAYIMHPSLVGRAKTKVKDASGAGGFILGDNGIGVLNGYRALRTNNMPSGIGAEEDAYGMLFANWADYFLGQWGSIDMLVDPYTQAREGMIRLIVNSYWNMGIIRDESFVTAALK